MPQVTTNIRTAITKTVADNYFFNVGGTWDGASVTLEWSAEGTAPWYPIKDSSDDDVVRIANSNGIVTTGIVGYLSANVEDGGGSLDLNVSLIPV